MEGKSKGEKLANTDRQEGREEKHEGRGVQ